MIQDQETCIYVDGVQSIRIWMTKLKCFSMNMLYIKPLNGYLKYRGATTIVTGEQHL